MRQAQCACGSLRVETTAEPKLVLMCHCEECQRRTGAPYGVSAYFDELKGSFSERFERAKKFRSYSHPEAPFLNARAVWERFMPAMVKEIDYVKVNGESVKFVSRKGSLDLPVKHLAPKMEIEISYSNDYSKAAAGLIRSKDPEDGSEYIYTDFEPYYAHNLFPCFYRRIILMAHRTA